MSKDFSEFRQHFYETKLSDLYELAISTIKEHLKAQSMDGKKVSTEELIVGLSTAFVTINKDSMLATLEAYHLWNEDE